MMKTIRINGVEQSIESETGAFGDFIHNLSDLLGKEHKVISCIKLNGKEISQDEEKAIQALMLENLGDIDIEVSNPADLAHETLNTLDQYIDRLVASIERAALHYTEKNLIAGDAYFVKSIDGLDLFVQTIGGIKLALRIGIAPKVALAEASLVSIMNDLLEAKRQNNYVFLAELLQKDLIENLNEWKNEVFPYLRRWRNN